MSYWKKFKKKYMGDRAFYRHYLLLAVPMILQNAITNLVSFLDNIMVGNGQQCRCYNAKTGTNLFIFTRPTP